MDKMKGIWDNIKEESPDLLRTWKEWKMAAMVTTGNSKDEAMSEVRVMKEGI